MASSDNIMYGKVFKLAIKLKKKNLKTYLIVVLVDKQSDHSSFVLSLRNLEPRGTTKQTDTR